MRHPDLDSYFERATSFTDFLAGVQKNAELWRGVYERAETPAAVAARVRALGGRWRLLVLLADWCGDAANTVPLLARLAEAAPNVTMRVLERDEHLELMDAHLTNGSRSIPVAIVIGPDGTERGCWGPRPAPLQAWVMAEGLALPSAERYREIRRWYARDRGVTTALEMTALLERAAGAAA